MELRYQDFRQYVASAIDCSDTSSISRLAQRYQKAATRMQHHQAATSAPATSVDGAVNSFAPLIEECKQYVPLANCSLLEKLKTESLTETAVIVQVHYQNTNNIYVHSSGADIKILCGY
jgi:hypothetical protein